MRSLLQRPMPHAVQTAIPLFVYSAFTALWIGRGVVLHPTTNVLGNHDRDKAILMWSFRWWPHALANGLDPFRPDVVWAPHGVDLAWVTSSPTLSLLLAPITDTLGPVFAYNFAALAAPPLAAWMTFLLARRLTGNFSASLVAGFLFGFSPYVISQSVDHLNLSFVVFVPLAGLLAVRCYDGSLAPSVYTAILGVVLALQFGVSTEIFATFTVVAFIVFVLAALLLDARRQVAALARYTLLAYLVAGVIVSPYLIHAFKRSDPPVRPRSHEHYHDLANILFPTNTTWLKMPNSHGIVSSFTSGLAELGGYIGLPLLLIVVLALLRQPAGRVRRGLWVLVLAAVSVELLAMGRDVTIAGRPIGVGVWRLVEQLPALGVAIPIRFVMYAALFIALVVALWLAQPGPRLWRYVLAGVAVVSFLPNPSGAFWASHVPQERFFATSAYREFVHPGDRALVFPYASRKGWSMLWQAETNFRFSMIGGHIGQALIPSECVWGGGWESLAGGNPPGGAGGFRLFLLAHGVNVVLVGPGVGSWPSELLASSLPDVTPVHAAGETIYRLRPGMPNNLPPGGPPLVPHRRHLNTVPVNAVCHRILSTGS